MSQKFLEHIFCIFLCFCHATHFIQKLLNLENVALPESHKTNLSQNPIVEDLSIVVIACDSLADGRNSQELFAFFPSINGMVVDHIKQCFCLCFFITLIPQDKVRVLSDGFFIGQLQEGNVNLHLILDPLNQSFVHKICILEHLECQLCSFLLISIFNLQLLADLVHQITKSDQILKSFIVFMFIAADKNKCLLDLTFYKDEISLQRNVNCLFSNSAYSLVFGIAFIKQPNIFNHIIFF